MHLLDDEYDRRLEAIGARVLAAYPDGLVAFCAYDVDADSLPVDNLDVVAVAGPARFERIHDPFFGEGNAYQSAVCRDVTWMEMIGIANQSVTCTGDTHHVFLEGIEPIGTTPNGTPRYRLLMGS
jgi:hypothetical protein